MRVAVCLCGQFRTAKQCKDNIINVFTKDRPNTVEVDFFAHTWDYSKSSLEGSKETVYEESRVADKVVDYFQPKKFVVEKMPEEFKEGDGWRQGQFYSISRSLQLRREYEKETGIRYNFVFFCRFDHFRIKSDTEKDKKDGYPDWVINWSLLPSVSKIPTLYNWFRTYEWVDWVGKGCWILHDFSWFCNGPAADILEGIYDMYVELCNLFRKKEYSKFWSENSIFNIPEKYLGLFCFLNDIFVEEDRGVYLPGCIVREGLEKVNLNTPEGREILIKILKRYGFRYTREDIRRELGCK